MSHQPNPLNPHHSPEVNSWNMYDQGGLSLKCAWCPRNYRTSQYSMPTPTKFIPILESNTFVHSVYLSNNISIRHFFSFVLGLFLPLSELYNLELEIILGSEELG